MSPYDETFFRNMDEAAIGSAGAIVPILCEMFRPTSVVDVGGGRGGWTAAFSRFGVKDCLCVDGNYVNRSLLCIPQDMFREVDLSKRLDLERRFDLAVCLEVAEHLPRDAASNLIDSLVHHADIVLFSAAVPGQGGTMHVNEQWPDYWTRLFADRNYSCFDCLRWKIWGDPAVSWWYKQNSLVYMNKARSKLPFEVFAACGNEVETPFSVVHPELYSWAMSRVRPSRYQGGLRGTVRRVMARLGRLADE